MCVCVPRVNAPNRFRTTSAIKASCRSRSALRSASCRSRSASLDIRASLSSRSSAALSGETASAERRRAASGVSPLGASATSRLRVRAIPCETRARSAASRASRSSRSRRSASVSAASAASALRLSRCAFLSRRSSSALRRGMAGGAMGRWGWGGDPQSGRACLTGPIVGPSHYRGGWTL